MTRHENGPELGTPSHNDDCSTPAELIDINPQPNARPAPSDRAMMAGYTLALSDVESYCRSAARELNRCANDLQNFDEDTALREFNRGVAFVMAAGELLRDLGDGGL